MRNLIVLAVALMLLVVVGCSTSRKAPRPQAMPQPQAQSDKRVSFSPEFKNTLQLISVNSRRGAGGYFTVEIKLRNTGTDFKKLSYEVNWMDAAGEAIDLPNMRVIPWSLMAGETSSMTITAPTPLARDFEIKFVPAAN